MSRRIGSRFALLLVLAFALVFGSTVVAGAGGGGCYEEPTQREGDVVRMVRFCFMPQVLRVAPGTDVTFVNRDPAPHNVASPSWSSPRDLRLGRMFTASFEREGVYPFACSYHYGMTGAVVVGDGIGRAGEVSVNRVVNASPVVAAEVAGGQPSPAPRSPWLAVVLGVPVALVGAAALAKVIRPRPHRGAPGADQDARRPDR